MGKCADEQLLESGYTNLFDHPFINYLIVKVGISITCSAYTGFPNLPIGFTISSL